MEQSSFGEGLWNMEEIIKLQGKCDDGHAVLTDKAFKFMRQDIVVLEIPRGEIRSVNMVPQGRGTTTIGTKSGESHTLRFSKRNKWERELFTIAFVNAREELGDKGDKKQPWWIMFRRKDISAD